MSRTQPIPDSVFESFAIDSNSSAPRFAQLYTFIKEGILSQRFQAGARLPATRRLAELLAVSRNTVNTALEQLMAEGYLGSRRGAGVFITEELPDEYFNVSKQKLLQKSKQKKSMHLSAYGRRVIQPARPTGVSNTAFRMGMPALPEFPHKQWLRILQQVNNKANLDIKGYNDMQGVRPLREAIAEYLKSSRAVACHSDQVIITNGAQQALDLTCRLLLDPQDYAAMEEPGYQGMRTALLGSGATPLLCPVTDQGLDLNFLKSQDKFIKLLYCTPAHQYPMGMTLPLPQRLELLQWMGENGGYIIEDDYDSEYHYQSRPIASLHGLDEFEQVIYMGSFSKVLFPGIRLGYLVVPRRLVPHFVAAKAATTGEISPVMELAVATFIREGLFSTHLKKMRTLYRQRLQKLIEVCEKVLSPWCHVHANGAGMHLVLSFRDDIEKRTGAKTNKGTDKKIDDAQVLQLLHARNINCSSLSSYYTGRIRENGLVLGFANADDCEIERSVTGIYEVLSSTWMSAGISGGIS